MPQKTTFFYSIGEKSGLVPRLIAALGTQRDRYQSASELQSYSGIAPVLASSGKQHWVHWRWACPKFVRQTFHEWAAHSIGSSAWAKAYYEQQRANGKPRNTVVRALAFKWIRILQRDFHWGKWFWSRLLIFLSGPLIFCVGLAQAYPKIALFIWL